MAFTYIIYSTKFDKYYVGSTKDFKARMQRHNSGGSEYTRKYMPWELKLLLEKQTLSEARILESKLKRLNKDRIKRFIQKYRAKDES